MADAKPGFRYLNKQGVESDAGFVVQFTGRFSLEYRRGTFRMECSTETAYPSGSLGVVVEVPALPFGNLSTARRLEIIAEIRAALDFMEITNDVH